MNNGDHFFQIEKPKVHLSLHPLNKPVKKAYVCKNFDLMTDYANLSI